MNQNENDLKKANTQLTENAKTIEQLKRETKSHKKTWTDLKAKAEKEETTLKK